MEKEIFIIEKTKTTFFNILSSLQAMVEVGGLSFKEGLRIYASVYMVRNIKYKFFDQSCRLTSF